MTWTNGTLHRIYNSVSEDVTRSSSASGIQSRGLEKDLVRTLIMRAVRFCQAKVYCTTPLSPFTFRRVLRERILLLNHLITHLARRFYPHFNTPSYIREERERLKIAFREEPDYSDAESMLSDAQSVLAVFFQALPLSKIVKLLPYFAEFSIRDESAGSSLTRQLTQSDILQHGIDLGPRLRSLYNRLLHDIVQGTLNLSTRAMCVVESALLVLDRFANTGDSHQVATVNLTQTLPEAKGDLPSHWNDLTSNENTALYKASIYNRVRSLDNVFVARDRLFVVVQGPTVWHGNRPILGTNLAMFGIMPFATKEQQDNLRDFHERLTEHRRKIGIDDISPYIRVVVQYPRKTTGNFRIRLNLEDRNGIWQADATNLRKEY